MALLTDTEVPYPFASVTGLVASGFTQDQAEAILVITRETTVAAIGRLENKLARWHVLLALYTLIQFGVVLLVVLVSQTRQEPLPRSAAISGGDPLLFSLLSATSASDVCRTPARFATFDATANVGVAHLRFGTHFELTGSREASVVSLKFRRALINQDSARAWTEKNCDSTQINSDRSYTSAATSGRHHAPKLDCDRPCPRVSRLIRHLDYGLA